MFHASHINAGGSFAIPRQRSPDNLKMVDMLRVLEDTTMLYAVYSIYIV